MDRREAQALRKRMVRMKNLCGAFQRQANALAKYEADKAAAAAPAAYLSALGRVKEDAIKLAQSANETANEIQKQLTRAS